jgi:hypothetical protein
LGKGQTEEWDYSKTSTYNHQSTIELHERPLCVVYNAQTPDPRLLVDTCNKSVSRIRRFRHSAEAIAQVRDRRKKHHIASMRSNERRINSGEDILKDFYR